MKILPLLILLSTGLVEHDDRVGARDCLALVVFSEARGESYLGQAAVAQVVINRAKEAGDGICEVAMKPGQFHGLERWPYPRRPAEIDEKAWEKAREVAAAVIEGDYIVQPPACASATYFFRGSDSRESWARDLIEVCRIDSHVFLVENPTNGS